MLTKRIIPCLDIKNERTVKGVHFVNLRDAGDPVMLAKYYAEVGADELVFLDISATIEGRKTMRDMVLKFEWALEVEKRGAGEILFTSMDHDGTKSGFANEALAKLSDSVHIPIIASGGAGEIEHFIEVFKCGKSDAALAASVFHFDEIHIPALKKELKENMIEVRI